MKHIVLTLKCDRCRRRNRVSIYDHTVGNPVCGSCRAPLCEFEIVNGYVYILSNESMPGLLKIGCTDRDVAEKVQELNRATGVPTVFKIEAVFFCSHSLEDERKIHSALETCRVPGKEFFRIALHEALKTIKQVLQREWWHLKPNKDDFG